ncbi:MAG: bleomycin hydrolase [Salibacteraceae bacterium]|jgi:bleomycin hydrolase
MKKSNMSIFKKIALLSAVALTTIGSVNAQDADTVRNTEDGGYLFTINNSIEATDVKNQYRSGTCWSFSALSFFEAEIERMTGTRYDLSEMFVVWHTYSDKATKTVRMYGELNFGPGGAFHDVVYVMKHYGMVPDTVYTGLNYGSEKHMHSEMDKVLKAMVDVIVDKPNKKLSTAWKPAIEGTLDAYLGELPTEFEFEGKKYTPKSFLEKTGLNPDDYIALTSFNHHPYYSEFAIAVADNWLWKDFYNLPIDEFMTVMESSLSNGYSIAWAADVSEKGFSFRDRLAVVPADLDNIISKGKDNKNFSDAGAEKKGSAFDAPVEELVITQENRQMAYDSQETTDDHGMHITGLATDQHGTKYYIVKNSWGTKNNSDGYFFASEAYVKYKTMNILVHKEGIPKGLKKKLGIK